MNLGVLEEENDSETNRVRFLSDFRNLNRQLKHKPYLMPKIFEMLLNL